MNRQKISLIVLTYNEREDVMQALNTDAQFFEIEIQRSIKCAKNEYKIAEIRTVEPKRIEGEGKLRTFKDGWIYLKLIMSEFFIRDKNSC